jgi:hypothetical protein
MEEKPEKLKIRVLNHGSGKGTPEGGKKGQK